MSGSGFRKNVQAILQTTPDNTEATRLVVQLLKDHGVSLRASWARSMLEPGLSGIRERSLGDTRLEALEPLLARLTPAENAAKTSRRASSHENDPK